MTNRRLHPFATRVATSARLGLLAALISMLVLVSVSGASTSTPLLKLGPIAIANHTATVTGTLASGSSNSTMTINGQPVGLDAAGAFAANVPLDGASMHHFLTTTPNEEARRQVRVRP